MRHPRVLLLASVLACSGCFQFATVITVKPDGSGTIDQRLLFTPAAVAQLSQLSALGGSQDFDPFSEQQARDAAATLGPGVTYVSSTPVETSDGVGRDIKYTFTDINTLRLDQAPPAPGSLSDQSGSDDRVSFKLTRPPAGTSLLTIAVPQLPAISRDRPAGPASAPSAEQLTMLKPMLAGARVSIDVEPAGQLVRTSSPFVSGNRVTLLDVPLDALLADATLLQRLQAAPSAAEAKAVLGNVPGLKLNLDPELTIEFR